MEGVMALDPVILNEIEHLQGLNPGEKAALGERMDLMRYQPGQIVFEYGDPGHALFIVRSGEVEIYIKNNQGDKIILEVSRPGDVFGEISLLDGGPRTASVVAFVGWSAVPPLALALVARAVKPLRPIAAGLAFGWAGLLLHAALVRSVHLPVLPLWMVPFWLLLGSFIAWWAARAVLVPERMR